MTPGDVLKRLRARKSLTRLAFCQKLSWSDVYWTESVLKKLETDETKFTEGHLKDLIKAGLVEPHDLFYQDFQTAMDLVCAVLEPVPVTISRQDNSVTVILHNRIAIKISMMD